MNKPNCYECKHRRDLPGDCHSKCVHPKLGKVDALVGMLATMLRAVDLQKTGAVLGVRGNPHGIRNGWFVWPFNFDPVWLESCDGFEAAEQREAKAG